MGDTKMGNNTKQYQVNDDTSSNYGWLALRFSHICLHVHESNYFAS